MDISAALPTYIAAQCLARRKGGRQLRSRHGRRCRRQRQRAGRPSFGEGASPRRAQGAESGSSQRRRGRQFARRGGAAGRRLGGAGISPFFDPPARLKRPAIKRKGCGREHIVLSAVFVCLPQTLPAGFCAPFAVRGGTICREGLQTPGGRGTIKRGRLFYARARPLGRLCGRGANIGGQRKKR